MDKEYLFGIVHIYEYSVKSSINSTIVYHKNMSIKIGSKLRIIWRFY